MSDLLSAKLESLRINRDAPPRSSWRVPVAALVCLAGAIAIALWSFPYIRASLFLPQAQITEISLLSPAQSSVDLSSSGYVVARRSAKVGAKVSGRLAQVLVKERDHVVAGQVLAVLDGSAERSALQTARARVAAATARLEMARANLSMAQLPADRDHALVLQGALPTAKAQESEANARAQALAVKSAEAEVLVAEAEVGALDVTLQQLTIRAPIDGTVINRPLRPGELVGPTTPTILELADFQSFIIETDVPEARLGMLRSGAPCEIILDAFPSNRFRGVALNVLPRIVRATAMVTVDIAFADPAPKDLLLPDMAARVAFLSKELDEKSVKAPPKLVVPASALTERGGRKVVFVVDNGRVRMTPVELGEAIGAGFELQRGPSAGTRVVKNPSPQIEEGQRIRERTD